MTRTGRRQGGGSWLTSGTTRWAPTASSSFYHAGDFFSRDGIQAGMMTLHLAGFPHGPHPKALLAALTPRKPATDEVAVMLDARDPLDVGEAASGVEFAGYVDSWGAANRRAERQAAE